MDRRISGFKSPDKKKPQLKEEYAMVLDVITGEVQSFRNSEVIQAIGFDTYTLLELVPKPGAMIKSGQKVYIGEGKRDEIQYIKRILFPDKLTGTAESELLFVLMDIIEEKEEMYVKFFNTAGPISLRKHSLEIIPGVGKKHFMDIIEEREKKPFENFKDISSRIGFLTDPVNAIAQRIMAEIMGKTEHRFFTKK